MDKELSMNQAFIKQLDAIIEAHLEDEQFGVEELAKELGLSRSQLHRKLNGITGKSTSQYIREYRLEKAMEMLQDDVATASEIAYRVGFGSSTYFNSSFHKYYGYPPGEVKFRNPSNEGDNEEVQSENGDPETITVKRRFFNLRTYLIGLLAVILVVIFAYYNFGKPEHTKTTENKSPNRVEHSIVVLPFKNWSGNPNLEYVSDGMTDAVISRLGKIKSIERVPPLTSVLGYKNTDKSISQIAQELDVKTVLQGSFQLSGDEVGIKLQLIDGVTEHQFWANDYHGKWNSNEIFALQAKVVENVIANMNLEITDAEIETIKEKPTENNEAYNSFLLANYQYVKGNEVAFKNAIPLYEKAISLDSSFVEAYLGLERVWMQAGLVWGIYDERVAWNKSKTLLQKALKLDSTDIDVAVELHRGYFYYDWNFVAVENFLKRKFTNDYKEASYYWPFIDYFIKTGRLNKASFYTDYLLKEEPFNTWGYTAKAWLFFFSDKKKESHEFISRYESEFVDDLNYLRESSKLYYYLGDYDSAKRELGLLMNNFSDRPPIIIWLNTVLANTDGKIKESQEYLNQLYQQYNDKTSGSPAWFIALYYCHIKDYEKAFEWLQKSYDRHEVEMLWLRENPLLRPLRTDPRYIKLYNKVGFSDIE